MLCVRLNICVCSRILVICAPSDRANNCAVLPKLKADYINSGFLPTDAFNDSSCKAHYKFESGFEDSTGIANGVAFNGATAGNASEIGANAFLGDNDSGFYSPSSASPLISDLIGGNNGWSVSMWFKIAPGTTTNCSLFHGSRGNHSQGW